MYVHEEGMSSLHLLNVQDEMGGVWEFRQALPIHTVIHEGAAPLHVNKPCVSKNLEVVRDRWLAHRKVPHDIANADG